MEELLMKEAMELDPELENGELAVGAASPCLMMQTCTTLQIQVGTSIVLLSRIT